MSRPRSGRVTIARMAVWQDALTRGDRLLLDGGTGTELRAPRRAARRHDVERPRAR